MARRLNCRYSSASVGHPHVENEPAAFYGDEDEAGYASEKEHSEDDLVDRATKTKKVSFAAENEQFNLKPDPDVKVIPGTLILHCFSSPHLVSVNQKALKRSCFSALAWPKNSKTKKLKEFFARKLKKPAKRFKFGANFDQKLNFQPKNRHFGRKNGIFPGNSRIFAKLKPEICQKLKKPSTPLSLIAKKTH